MCHHGSGLKQQLGTVENHGNTEIMETVIFIKCRESVILPKCRVLCQNAVVLYFWKNILFLISLN